MGKRKDTPPSGAEGTARAWFAVLDNPADHGLPGTPEEVLGALRDKWTAAEPDGAIGMTYCISGAGMPHVHMALCYDRPVRWQTPKKLLGDTAAHIEPMKGTKGQALDYIYKRGKYAEGEDGEKVVCDLIHGELQDNRVNNGGGKIADQIHTMIWDEGLTPAQIMDAIPDMYRHETIIRKMYFRYRELNTTALRDVEVHWITGETGTGKSYTYVRLREQYGADQVYMYDDYEGGGWDAYNGQDVVVLDEFRGQMRQADFLKLLDKYPGQAHARYSNVSRVWTKVYILTIQPPEAAYRIMRDNMGREYDMDEQSRRRESYKQLLRRLTDVTLCYKTPAGEYKRYTVPAGEYKGYEDLVRRAGADEYTGWTSAADDDALPFN